MKNKQLRKIKRTKLVEVVSVLSWRSEKKNPKRTQWASKTKKKRSFLRKNFDELGSSIEFCRTDVSSSIGRTYRSDAKSNFIESFLDRRKRKKFRFEKKFFSRRRERIISSGTLVLSFSSMRSIRSGKSRRRSFLFVSSLFDQPEQRNSRRHRNDRSRNLVEQRRADFTHFVRRKISRFSQIVSSRRNSRRSNDKIFEGAVLSFRSLRNKETKRFDSVSFNLLVFVREFSSCAERKIHKDKSQFFLSLTI